MYWIMAFTRIQFRSFFCCANWMHACVYVNVRVFFLFFSLGRLLYSEFFFMFSRKIRYYVCGTFFLSLSLCNAVKSAPDSVFAIIYGYKLSFTPLSLSLHPCPLFLLLRPLLLIHLIASAIYFFPSSGRSTWFDDISHSLRNVFVVLWWWRWRQQQTATTPTTTCECIANYIYFNPSLAFVCARSFTFCLLAYFSSFFSLEFPFNLCICDCCVCVLMFAFKI